MTLPRQGQRAVQRARDALFAANPSCHWCGTVTLHPSVAAGNPNMATLDHIRPRRECVSFEQYSSAQNHVLACFECNALRDTVDIALMEHQKKQQALLETWKKPKQEQQPRSGKGYFRESKAEGKRTPDQFAKQYLS